MLVDVLRLMRSHQYVKNFLIFAPMLFSFCFSYENVCLSIVAFVLFCIVASATYIFNDIFDVEQDQKHPSKRFRPIASGSVSVGFAVLLVMLLSGVCLFASYIVSKELFYVLGGYFLLTTLYSSKLKHVALIDVCIVALGFIFRLFAGAVMTGVHLSMWIVIMTFL